MFISDKNYFYSHILKVTPEKTDQILSHKKDFYKKFEIPKDHGKRTIHAISKQTDLYWLQKKLNDNLLVNVVLPIAVKGFTKGESYFTYLIEHINKKSYLRVDIKSFFDTIKVEQIKGAFQEFVNLDDVLETIIDIVTLENKLPQGALTSPSVSNIIFRRIDQRITKYCQKFNVTYTRYADDMLFSSNTINFAKDKYFYSMIKHILEENGFQCNYSKKKTEIEKMCLGGFVIERDIHLSRSKLRNINKLIYFFRLSKDFNSNKYSVNMRIFADPNWLKEVNELKLTTNKGAKLFTTSEQLLDYLCGYRAFLISVVKNNPPSSLHVVVLNKKIKNIEKIIDVLIEKL